MSCATQDLILNDSLVQLVHNILMLTNPYVSFSQIALLNGQIMNNDWKNFGLYSKNTKGNFKLIEPFFCPLSKHWRVCGPIFTKSGVLEFASREADAVQEKASDSIFLQCQSPVRKHISYKRAQDYMLYSKLVYTYPNTFFSNSCVILIKILTPFIFGSMSANGTFRRQLMHFTYKYIAQNMPRQLSVNTLTTFIEILTLNVFTRFCHELQSYSEFSATYNIMKQSMRFTGFVNCYFYPLMGIFGVTCNLILLIICITEYRKNCAANRTYLFDIGFVSLVDLIYVTSLALPPAIHCWYKELPSTWGCPGIRFLRGVLHSTSAWGVVFLGIKTLSRRIMISTPKIQMTAKCVVIVAMSLAANSLVFFTDRAVIRAGLFIFCARLKWTWVTPFYSSVFFTAIRVVLPLTICVVKNLLLLRLNFLSRRSDVREDISKIQTARNTVMVICLRFIIFSLPSIVDFSVQKENPFVYTRGSQRNSLSISWRSYVPQIATLFLTINYSIDLFVVLTTRKEFRLSCKTLCRCNRRKDWLLWIFCVWIVNINISYMLNICRCF